MKFYSTTVIGLAIAASSLFALARAECGDEDESCIVGGKPCTGREEECCDGMGCFGFNFYKVCKDPPVCLDEWHDCSQGIECCGTMVCALTTIGAFECQQPKIGTRSVEITGGLLIEEPKPEEIPTDNLKTTKKISDAVLVACVSGDSHVSTFDGLKYDCQGHGEFILGKSTITRREFQGRFHKINEQVSVMRGIVVQDEGATPRVQVTTPMVDEGVAEMVNGCPVQLFVDGEQISLVDGLDSNDVKIKFEDTGLKVTYHVSELLVNIKLVGGKNCAMNACFSMPDTDDVMIGMIGSPDDDFTNDWMDRAGNVIAGPKPPRGPTPYAYSVDNWCIRDEAESMFFYNQRGVDFHDFGRCDALYGGLVTEEILALVTPADEEICKKCLACLEDATLGNKETAIETKKVCYEKKKANSCNGEGADCDCASCCDGFKCRDDGLAGKVCVPENERAPTIQVSFVVSEMKQ
jgi:hypothetical protein